MPSNNGKDPSTQSHNRQTWERPVLTYVGNVGEVLQAGGGKLTPSPSDPGEVRKPKPASQG